MNNDKAMREFEEWAKFVGYDLRRAREGAGYDYYHTDTNSAWFGFQGGWSATKAAKQCDVGVEVNEIIEALEELELTWWPIQRNKEKRILRSMAPYLRAAQNVAEIAPKIIRALQTQPKNPAGE